MATLSIDLLLASMIKGFLHVCVLAKVRWCKSDSPKGSNVSIVENLKKKQLWDLTFCLIQHDLGEVDPEIIWHAAARDNSNVTVPDDAVSLSVSACVPKERDVFVLWESRSISVSMQLSVEGEETISAARDLADPDGLDQVQTNIFKILFEFRLDLVSFQLKMQCKNHFKTPILFPVHYVHSLL